MFRLSEYNVQGIKATWPLFAFFGGGAALLLAGAVSSAATGDLVWAVVCVVGAACGGYVVVRQLRAFRLDPRADADQEDTVEVEPTLIVDRVVTLPGGDVKVVGHGRRLLRAHLAVEVTTSQGSGVQEWHDGDVVEVGGSVYIVTFFEFHDFSNGIAVGRLIYTGSLEDPAFRRTIARATRAEFGR